MAASTGSRSRRRPIPGSRSARSRSRARAPSRSMSNMRSSSSPRQRIHAPPRSRRRSRRRTRPGPSPRRCCPAGRAWPWSSSGSGSSARADHAADERREDDLVGPVDRLAQLAQPARDDRPAGDEAECEGTPKVLIEMPRTWISGFMAANRRASGSSRNFRADLCASATISLMARQAPELRQGHGPAGAHAAHHVPARPRLRRSSIGVLFAAGAGAGMIVVVAGGAVRSCSCSPRTSSRCAAMGAKRSRPQEAPELHAMIERLCVQADLPKPRVAVAETADAERVRDGALAEVRDGLRDHAASSSCSRPPSSRA